MERRIEFKVNNITLRGSLYIPSGKGPFPAVIFFHGNGGKGEKYFEAAKLFPQKGIMSLAFNFRGCGISDGDYSIQTHEDVFEDAKRAIKFLLTQNVDPERIGVVGGSFGGYIAAMILPKINIKSLVLLSSSAHDNSLTARLDMGPLEKEVEYFRDEKNWINAKSYKNIANFKNPLLVIKSDHDENVPSQVVDRYFEKAINSKRREIKTIKNADHRLSTQEMRDEFFKLILDWFSKTL